MTPKPQYYMNETCFSSALNSKRIILQLSMFFQQKRSLGYKQISEKVRRHFKLRYQGCYLHNTDKETDESWDIFII